MTLDIKYVFSNDQINQRPPPSLPYEAVHQNYFTILPFRHGQRGSTEAQRVLLQKVI